MKTKYSACEIEGYQMTTKTQAEIWCKKAWNLALLEGCSCYCIKEHADHFSYKYKRDDWENYNERVFYFSACEIEEVRV